MGDFFVCMIARNFPNLFCNSFIKIVHVVIRALRLDKKFQ